VECPEVYFSLSAEARAALERVLHVYDVGGVALEVDADDVEAQCAGLEASLLQVDSGQGAELRLFAGGYGLEGVSEGGALAQLHLDEDEGTALAGAIAGAIAVAEDQVDLTVAGAVVAFDEGVAESLEVFEGEVLAEPSGGAAVQGPTPA
jgi:hypothetical protein